MSLCEALRCGCAGRRGGGVKGHAAAPTVNCCFVSRGPVGLLNRIPIGHQSQRTWRLIAQATSGMQMCDKFLSGGFWLLGQGDREKMSEVSAVSPVSRVLS